MSCATAGRDSRGSCVKQDDVLARFIAPLRDLCAWLGEDGIPHAIIGGVAASLLGRPRATRDIDAVVMMDEEEWATFLDEAEKHGFPPREKNSLAFALKSRVFLLQHKDHGINVDISLGALPFEQEVIARAVRIRIEDVDVRLATPEDLIVMKSLAMRPHDITDIESLLDANRKLDLTRVRRWVGALAGALDTPEIAERLETVLTAWQQSRSPGSQPKKES